MRPVFFGLLTLVHILSIPAPVLSQGRVIWPFVTVAVPEVTTFEDLVPASQTEITLTNQIRGVSFIGEVFVHDPATIRNSVGVPLSAATSGSAAATTFGTAMRFEHPVIQISAKVSPGFLTVNGVSGSVRVDLIGLDDLSFEATPNPKKLRPRLPYRLGPNLRLDR